MVEQFLENYVKKIVQHPDKVSISVAPTMDGCRSIVIYTSPLDIGRVIGKDGKMISALKTFISGAKAKDGLTYKIVVQANDSKK
ncbi:KH domain-containing protein [Helicobacter cappadocius]|uniref:KH domain-containing protein n=1 Tax=Helicobacter cappadocius TaxID=3063998 RepID=A0AA90SSQ1_9HELI|nr:MULTISPECIES: KH domain-containing protein [unclassified Helicobacter]MDO7253255.1 KH domain-containing protein [Helicobacter sp. faydin-H75]MDP2539179.1 KH domain-containing protein [Helicobacter sp. faydin-H76]